MFQYVLFIDCTTGKKSPAVNWQTLAQKYGFSIERESITHCVVNAEAEALARLEQDNPHILVADPQAYHRA